MRYGQLNSEMAPTTHPPHCRVHDGPVPCFMALPPCRPCTHGSRILQCNHCRTEEDRRRFLDRQRVEGNPMQPLPPVHEAVEPEATDPIEAPGRGRIPRDPPPTQGPTGYRTCDEPRNRVGSESSDSSIEFVGTFPGGGPPPGGPPPPPPPGYPSPPLADASQGLEFLVLEFLEFG